MKIQVTIDANINRTNNAKSMTFVSSSFLACSLQECSMIHPIRWWWDESSAPLAWFESEFTQEDHLGEESRELEGATNPTYHKQPTYQTHSFQLSIASQWMEKRKMFCGVGNRWERNKFQKTNNKSSSVCETKSELTFARSLMDALQSKWIMDGWLNLNEWNHFIILYSILLSITLL